MEMKWRDIRLGKPTKASGDQVLMLHNDGSIGLFGIELVGCVVAWMPLSELPKFEPIPDPPPGYRYKVEGDKFDRKAVYLSSGNKWHPTLCTLMYDPYSVYCVPIEPPAPKYRPFANAEEYAPHFNRVVDKRSYRHGVVLKGGRKFTEYDDETVSFGDRSYTYIEVFNDGHRFLDGDKEPFGVKVEP